VGRGGSLRSENSWGQHPLLWKITLFATLSSPRELVADAVALGWITSGGALWAEPVLAQVGKALPCEWITDQIAAIRVLTVATMS
jgi:hypothetical protein